MGARGAPVEGLGKRASSGNVLVKGTGSGLAHVLRNAGAAKLIGSVVSICVIEE